MKILRRQDGFTLLELLVASLVALTLSLAGWVFQRVQGRDLANQSALIDATDQLRGAMGFLSREIRLAGYDPRLTALVTPGLTGIIEARADRLLIRWDADKSGAIDLNAADPNAESVLYTYDAANRRILRTVAGVASTLIDDVPAGGFVFDYYDVLGNPLVPSGSPAELTTAQRDLVAYVRLRLGVDTVGTTSPVTLRMTSRVAVRNRILGSL